MTQYFDPNPVTPSDRKAIPYRMNGINFEFFTDTSVFSRKEVDFGTDLLISTLVRDIKERGPKMERFVDLGCGVGIVGIVIKSCFMAFDVTGVDINSRAVALASVNAINNGINCRFLSSDILFAVRDERFDIIATNPPVRAGKKTVFGFYEQSYELLNPGGYIYVVLQRKQGAPSTMEKLKELFGNCETLSIDGGYRVMRSRKE
ncbi:MAG: class I SAM-dependent methyltransferase [Lachnospiraceae bacterium]|nr:class I SAM-dependent methyltransferase [Lachnospiraceae bacterium]